MKIETVSLIEPNLITAQSISENEQQPPSFFSHATLVQEHIADIRLAEAK